MATFQSLVQQKSNRLESIPNEFLSSVEKYQRKLFSEILTLLDNLKRDSQGKIIFNSGDLSNLNIIQAIQDDLKNTLFGGDYVNAVDKFAQEFDSQAEITDKYFEIVFPDVAKSAAADAVLLQSKQSAVELLIGEPLDSNFLLPIKSILEDAVQSGASWIDTVQNIRDFVEGNPEADGKLLQYSKLIAHDEFAIADRSYTNAQADEAQAEWYVWLGNELPTSRCFCKERMQKYFHYKEIEQWAEGEKIGACDLGDGTWAGERDGTNAQTIFNFAGGYNCEHSINPVSVFDVPKDVIERNISNGNYQPTDKEAELLGI